jgi:hypothetical protein
MGSPVETSDTRESKSSLVVVACKEEGKKWTVNSVLFSERCEGEKTERIGGCDEHTHCAADRMSGSKMTMAA